MHPLEQLRDDALAQIASAPDERVLESVQGEDSSDAAAASPNGATK